MNVGRLLRTVSYLKPIQICYQIRYRVFGFKRIKSISLYPDFNNIDISVSDLDEDEKYINRFRPIDILSDRIILLNNTVKWEKGRWDYPDKTHLWNFNLHYFEYGIALIAAYKKTGDGAYFEKLLELYNDWHDNALKKYNKDAWHPYTISLRLRNLLIIYGMLDIKEKYIWIDCVKRDIYDQYIYLYINQEKNLLGNHYFENLVTLYICSMFFGDEKRRRKISSVFKKEVKEQILPDGMHFERSFMYHNLILEDLLRVYKIADASIRRDIKSAMEKMVNCVYSFELEERLPQFNDAASNVAKRKSQLINAAKDIMKYKPLLISELKYAGYYRYCNNGFTIIVDAGDIAPSYISGHSHCDTLSFELFYRDKPVLVNSGTYNYQTKHRIFFRSTVSHNTLQAINCEQSEIWGEHRTGKRSEVISYCYDSERRCVKGLIKDYKGNELTRKIIFDAGIQIEDHSDVDFKNYWHIHPDNIVEIIDEKTIRIELVDGGGLWLKALDDAFEDISNRCLYSEEIGKKELLDSYRSSSCKIRLDEE